MIGAIYRSRYELLQELGVGPVFRAFIARDLAADKNVVVRVIDDQIAREGGFIERLQEAVNETRAVRHPQIGAPIEVNEHGGKFFLVTRYVIGQSLSHKTQRATKFGTSSAVSIAIRVLELLDETHRLEIVHGDLRPENIVLTSEGEAGLLLPGMWRAYADSGSATKAILQEVAPYRAPELAAGSAPTKSSDIYAVGVLLYELLAGSRPFGSSSLSELEMQHAEAPRPSLRERVGSLPEPLEKIVHKAMERVAAVRYKDASEMLRDLRLLQEGLRFGRAMSWPLEPAKREAGQRVGPKLNVVWAETKDKKMSEKRMRDADDGAPKWLAYTAYVTGGAALLVVLWWLVMSLSAPRTLHVPNIVGMSFNEASAILTNMNLKLRQTKVVESERYAEGVIVSVRPAVNREVKEHGFVDATVSSGSKFVEVPDLAGKTVEEAKRLLTQMGLILSEKVQHVFSDSVASGTIVSQKPAKHMQVARKTEVQVDVSKGAAVIEPDEPPPLEPYVYHLSWTLPDGTQSIRVRVEMKDATGLKTVYESRHEPNEKVEIDVEGLGDRATFIIYYDDKVVKTLTEQAEKPEAPATASPVPATPEGGQ